MNQDIEFAKKNLERVLREAKQCDPHDPEMKEKVDQARAQLVVAQQLEANKAGKR